MKHLLKPLLYLFLLSIFFTSCRKDHGYDNGGTIIGHDYRKCMCCGGWFIVIEKDTLRFDQIPEGCSITLDDPKYPIDVYLDWHPKEPQCLGDEIIVTRMELKK
jgi:hypothetical protein